MTPLILKRASASRPSGEWREDDYDVFADGVELIYGHHGGQLADARLNAPSRRRNSLQQPPATSIATIKPSYYCPPVTSLLATRRIALLPMHPPR
jgi:hypothetical protein